jgi:hypothetical protein
MQNEEDESIVLAGYGQSAIKDRSSILHFVFCIFYFAFPHSVQTLRCRDDWMLSIFRYLVTVRRATG